MFRYQIPNIHDQGGQIPNPKIHMCMEIASLCKMQKYKWGGGRKVIELISQEP